MPLQEYRDPKDQTRYGYDSQTRQGIAFSNPQTYQQYGFSGFNPNAPVANFDTSALRTAPDKLRPIITSQDARSATTSALGTLTQAENNPVANPSLNRISEQVNQYAQSIRDAGGVLSPQEQQLYNSLTSLNGKQLATLSSARAASDGQDYRGLVGNVNAYTDTQAQRSKILNDLFSSLSQRTSDLQVMQNLFGTSTEEAQTMNDVNKKKAELRSFDTDTIKKNLAIEDKPIEMGFIQGEQAALQRQRDLTRLGLSNELSALVDVLNSQTATRQQKLEAAKFAFDANRQTLSDTIELYKMMAPENISTKVDEHTGQMTVINRNPITGEVTTQNLGQVGTPQKWIENIKYAQENGVSKPFYMRDEQTVINTNTGREYSTKEQYLAEGGVADFSNVQKIEPQINDKLLSVTEAARLGVPYGTTQQEAIALSQTPSFGKTSSNSSNKSSKIPTITTDQAKKYALPTTTPKENYNAVVDAISEAKRTYKDEPYYDQWGIVVDWMRDNELNPDEWDNVLWELFHPDGLKGKSSKRSV